jgi:hypothetical protein
MAKSAFKTLLLAAWVTLIPGKNLTLLSQNMLDNHELLDVYLHNNLAFIPGGLGGLNIVDISVPNSIQIVGYYYAEGCDWGRIYAWAVWGNYAYGTGRQCGIHIVDISSYQEPGFVNLYRNPERNDVRYEHPATQNGYLYAARHQAGVEVLSLEDPENPQPVAEIPSVNAWATLPDSNLLFIADGGGGFRVVDIADPANPTLLAVAATTGTAKDIARRGDYLFVAVGASGVDMFDVREPSQPLLVSNYNTSGYASRVAANDSLVAVSDWDDVEVLRYTNGYLELVGYKNTGGRVMALDLRDDLIFSAEWRHFNIFQYGAIADPDVDYTTRKIEFPRVPAGSSLTIGLTMSNSGGEPLSILGFQLPNPDFSLTLPAGDLLPGQSYPVTITYTPAGGSWSAQAHIETNDPDEAVTAITILGNYSFGPMVGDPAPSFSLPLVNGEGNLGLADLAGQPAVIAFFTAW